MASQCSSDLTHTSTYSTDTALKCWICSNHFEVDGHRHPRILKCGHTFCTKCILETAHGNSIECPYCFAATSFDTMGVYALPINSVLVKLIHDLTTDICSVCKKEEAVKICYRCDPVGCRLCERCCTLEHERDFAPVRTHKPISITCAKSCVISNNKCHTHIGQPLGYYSERTEKFACKEYLDDQPEHVKADYVQVEIAVQSLKSRVTIVMRNLDDYFKRLQDSQDIILTMQSQLMEIGPKAIQDIKEHFVDFKNKLQARQNSILNRANQCLADRKKQSDSHLVELREIREKLISQKEELHAIMQKEGRDFLGRYQHTFSSTCALLDAENPALQRLICDHNISVYIPDDFIEDLHTVGSVGGGPDVVNFRVHMFNGLLHLQWNLSHRQNVIKEYEIEYQVQPISHGADREGPSYVKCHGHALQCYMQCLCPGYTYTFRMRSSIFSGCGMWTKPLTVKYDDFPCTISFTGQIVQIKIPAKGRYRIIAKGAKAADGKNCNGGRGAIISAEFILQEGDVLDILCGGMSDCQGYHSGGGGGTFVSVNTREFEALLVVAGGGGGTRGCDSEDVDGCDGSLKEHGTKANSANCAESGNDGAPGRDATFTGPSWGHGGAGWSQNSSTAQSFVNGGNGGECGGFGGGGGVGMYGGGGGGGFSGGGGGRGGGGGGSYVREDGDNVNKQVGNMGHGEVKILTIPIENDYSLQKSKVSPVPSSPHDFGEHVK